MENLRLSEIPVVILCGGKGILLYEETCKIPKALVKINNYPMIYHIIQLYYINGFRKFILASGYQTEEFQEYFKTHFFKKAEIRIIDTGLNTSTGDRIKQLKKYLEHFENFALTYSDTLADIPLKRVYEHFLKNNVICTLVASKLPTRFLILGMRPGEDIIRGFTNRPVIENDWINGGFYFFKKDIFLENYLGRQNSNTVLEEEILYDLAKNNELIAFKHKGFWQHLDNDRDLIKIQTYLNQSKVVYED